MKSELLKVLRQADDYVSGQQLCSRFGVSRTAVWKAIRQLQEAGYEIDAVNNRGYRLLSAPDLLTPEEIRSRLHTGFMGQNCICLESVDSTNNYVKKLAENGAEEGMLVLAEEQTGGKGRRGRVWETPKGKNIAMSLLLRPKIHPAHASQLTLLMAMAVGEAIRSCTGLEAGIKWPNDVVVNDRKICGILTEMNTEVDYINYVVIGTGINVNQQEFPEELREIAGSLRQNLGKETGRAAIVAASMDEMERLYDIFRKTEDLSALKDDYNRCCVNRGHGIRVMERGEAYTGTTEGINDHGELVVCKDSGEEVLVYAGEVSVRGLYGYT
ncbi:MAG: biotin--[acetyl-CoA-carboxylase] ligase [Lachnospiraceae bacterium]|nr:biotin--[acetyl-CoA-carboxylase] ligase [Lachnospiraceae bacterium]